MVRSTRRASMPQASPSAPARRGRGRKSNQEPDTPQHDDDMDVDHEDEEEEEEEEPLPQAGPSRRGRKPGRGRGRPPKRARVKSEAETETDGDDDDAPSQSSRRRSGKQVSYKEIAVDADELEDIPDDVDDDDDDEEEEKVERKPVATPTRKRRAANKDDEDKPYKREGGGGGRGGFSVKGAAAAAARARWDKVRRERAERGDDSDDGGSRRRPAAAIKKDPRGALENVIEGQRYTIKGVEYMAGNDELILPDNEKGDTKIDADGHLLGGRTYKLQTFTSKTRKNPNRVYALTIDAARACGYTDSLAFLRRCPQVVKLSCDPAEREMLIEIGRITGNLKHRMVTMVSIRNVYKLMGARVVQNGKWVDDDYDEEKALVECEANGWTPHEPVLEEELAVNQYPSAGGPGRPPANAGLLADAAAAKSMSLSSWYTVGGPTTHFGGNGVDPWTDFHAKRGKLRQLGVSEEDWMLRTAEESRRIDETLREYREERLQVLTGVDGTRGWVYATEAESAGESKAVPKTEAKEEVKEDKPASKEEAKHPLATELTIEASSEPLSPAPPTNPASVALEEVNGTSDNVNRTIGGKIVVELPEETKNGILRSDKWVPGVIRAAYEPHTQMPHVPLRTQPSVASSERLSYQPLLGLNGEAKIVTAPTIASVEVVFDPALPEDPDTAWFSFGEQTRGADVAAKRLAMIAEAENWERESREKQRLRGSSSVTAPSSTGTI